MNQNVKESNGFHPNRPLWLKPPFYEVSERELNNELIELRQEMIIEQEEHVSPYPMKEQRKANRNVKKKKLALNLRENLFNTVRMKNSSPFLLVSLMKSIYGGWFEPGN